MSEKSVPKPSRAACERYLKRYDRRLRLGRYVNAGGAGVIYELEGTPTPQVVKIVDTRFMADRDGSSANDKSLRKKCGEWTRREIELMKLLKGCPRVMPILGEATYDCPNGEDPGSYVSVSLIVMPKMTPLMQYIKAGNPVTENDILQLGLDTGAALQACGGLKIMHRDLKPGNIFVTHEDGRLRFVLGDFGISRRVENLGEEAVTQIGTNYYVAPEVRYGDPIRYRNADIYSLGVTMFKLLADDYPILKKDPVTNRTEVTQWFRVMPEFRPILEKALQIDQELRYHDVDGLLRDLSRVRITRRSNVIVDPYATAAKEALCQGRNEEALKCALEGIHARERGCRRLLAYCLYLRDPMDERVLDLLDESFNEGDATGILIRGMIYAARGELEHAGLDIRDAACSNAGCVPAWYYYGRFLYTGACPGIPRDQELGLLYLQRAAEREFFPALRIMKRIYEKNRSMDLPAELVQLLQRDYAKDDPMEWNDIVRFL